jgi:shikimate kinase
MDNYQYKLQKPLVLIGMMGTGKSNVGRMLAQCLDVSFYDSDEIVEERAGCSIAEIFERYGEQKFRQSEAKVIAEIATQGASVMASGGGALTTPQTLDLLMDRAIMVWVQSDPADILRRVSKNGNRPLLAVDDPAAVIERLMRERQPLYEKAHIRVMNAQGRLEDTCAAIIGALKEHHS